MTSVGQSEPIKMSMQLDAPFVKEEMPDEEDYFKIEPNIDCDEHSMILKSDDLVKIPLKAENKEFLVQLVPTDVWCVKSEPKDSCKDLEQNKVPSGHFTNSFEVNVNDANDQQMSFLKEECILEIANDDIIVKDESVMIGHLCDSSNYHSPSSSDSTTSESNDFFDRTDTSTKSDDLNSSMEQAKRSLISEATIGINGVYQMKEELNTDGISVFDSRFNDACDSVMYVSKNKMNSTSECDPMKGVNVCVVDDTDRNTNYKSNIKCEEIKLENVVIKQEDNEHNDYAFDPLKESDTVHLQYKTEAESLITYSENQVVNHNFELSSGEELCYAAVDDVSENKRRNLCTAKKSGSSYLEMHKMLPTDQKPFSCVICNKKYARASRLKRHKRFHTGLKPYVCDICNKSFSKTGYLNKHKRIHSGEKPYVCDICNKSFSRSSGLKEHERVHTGLKPYVCDICNKMFSQAGSLYKHKRFHSGEKPYACDICKKSFSEIGYLNKHKRIHSGEKPYVCDICNKTFSRSSVLKEHARVHTGLKPYVCDICNKMFSQAGSLYKHKRFHSGEKPYACDICNKSFSEIGYLNKHKTIHSGAKPYACDICNKSFSRSSVLKEHERVHTGLKPYVCDICKKTFSQAGSLYRHKRFHSCEMPYACDICNKTFSELENLNKHKSVHTGQKP